MAITTAAQLCNVALARVGQRQLLDNLDEKNEAARLCKALYGPARDAVLELFAWPFAMRRAALALLAPGSERDGWAYAYDLPSECLAPREIWAGTRAPARDQRIPWALEDDATAGRILLTDQSEAVLLYTRAVETVGLFPPLFVDTVAWKLACDLALSLPVKPQLLPMLDRKYQMALASASAAALNQRQEDAPPDAEWIRGR